MNRRIAALTLAALLAVVGRALGESISLKKTEGRLCRQLGRRGLDRWIQRRLIEQAAGRIEDDTLLVLDISDVTKKYAEKMENMGRVRDGSEKELGRGYWTLNVVGTNTKGTKIVPLYGLLFSHRAEGHESENKEIREAIGQVAEVLGKRGIWVMDRGGDRPHVYYYLLPNGHRFMIRVRADRGLQTAQGIEPAVELAHVLSYITRWRIEEVIRFVKQSYQLEDVRCLTYHRLQALMVLVTAAAYFAAVYLELRMKLRILAGHVLRASKRVFGIPDFRLYALADGIRQFLYSQTQGVKKFLEQQNPMPVQPRLFDT